MKVLVVYAHPNPKSFNHAILEEVRAGLGEAGHEVKVKDLYALGLKTTLDGEDFTKIFSGATPEDVVSEQEDLAWAEGLVFIYPTWWLGTPAILKGWIDRVLLHGFAYRIGPAGPEGLLRHRKALVFATTGVPEALYEAQGAREIMVLPVTKGTLGFCGVQDVSHKVFFGLPATDEVRAGYLKEARDLAKGF